MSEELTKNALKGTQHPSTQTGERDLLFGLGIRGMQRRAGYVPSITYTALPDTASVDEKILCDERTARQFQWLMQSNFRGLRFTWLTKFAETGQRLPDELIPIVMDSQRSAFGVFRTPQFQGVVGKRAQWLAELSQNEHWLWFNSDRQPAVNRFTSRTHLNRTIRYKHLRQDNKDEAQSWLYQYWNALSLNDRLSVLDTMREDLTLEDLPFLMEQIERLDEARDASLLDKLWYMVTLLDPEMLKEVIAAVRNFVLLDYLGRRSLPVLDLRWSNSFHKHPQHTGRATLRKLAAYHRWWESLAQLLRLVPLDQWLEYCQAPVEVLLSGSRNGLHGELFLSLWQQRAIDEGHEAFAFGILCHQKPITYYFGWRVSKQSKLLSTLSFERIQTLLDEVWMKQSEETGTWLIR